MGNLIRNFLKPYIMSNSNNSGNNQEPTYEPTDPCECCATPLWDNTTKDLYIWDNFLSGRDPQVPLEEVFNLSDRLPKPVCNQMKAILFFADGYINCIFNSTDDKWYVFNMIKADYFY